MSDRGSEQRQRQLPTWWTLARDVMSFLGGWALAFMEAQRPDIRESVLIFAATAVGVPAGAIGVQAIADVINTRRSGGTAEQSSPSQDPAPSQSPP